MKTNRPALRTLDLLAICAGAGLVVGLEIAVLEALWNGYPSLGYWRNAMLVGRPLVAACSAAGFAAGLALSVFLPAYRTLVGPSFAAARGVPIGIGLAGAGLALVIITAWLLIAGVSPGFILPAVIGAAVVLALSAMALKGIVGRATGRVLPAFLVGLVLLVLKYAALRFVYLRFIQTGESVGLGELVLLLLGTCLVVGLAALVMLGPRSGGPVPELLLAVSIAIPVSLWLATAAPVRGQDPGGGRPNVLLIGVDTLRLDRVLTGDVSSSARRPVAPRLASYARDGVVFTRAISQAPWTMPAFASIMTGLYPFEHGADSLVGSLSRGRVTLAEKLSQAGYATGAIVSHYYVARKVGLTQGFELVDEDNIKGHRGESSTGVTDGALDFIDSRNGEPFFLFAHYFDPHYEYEDHPEMEMADGYVGWLDRVRDLVALRLMRHMLSPGDIEHIRDLYDEEVAHTDAQIGRLLDGLKERGLYGNTVIVIVADHGEELMERGWLGHTVTLHDEVVRVPLILILPGEAPAEPIHHETVETRSVFATVLDHLGIEREVGGRNLLGAFGKEAPDRPTGAFSAVWMPEAHLQSGKRVRMASYHADRWKLIIDIDKGREMLYDLESDPLESDDRAAAGSEVLAPMRSALKGWLERMLAIDRPGDTRTLTEEELEMLRSLGYM